MLLKRFLYPYKCPICKQCTLKFGVAGNDSVIWDKKYTIGGGKRDTMCTFCGSVDRDRLTYLFLTKKYNIHNKSKIKILHIAPEFTLSNFLRSLTNIDYIAGDLRCEGYIYPEYVVNKDITKLDDVDCTYDLIICNHVLEHVPNDIIAMSELYRVLKAGGIAILQVPMSIKNKNTCEDKNKSKEERYKEYGQEDHLRLYGADYIQRLKNVGFNVTPIYMSLYYNVRYKLNPIEPLFVCHK